MKKMQTRKKKKVKPYLPLFLMMVPGMLYLLINNYLPMAGLIIAFKQYNFRDGIFGSKFAGFSNFEYLFKSSDAFIITRNTLLYNLAFIVLNAILAVTISIVLYELKSRMAKKIYQTVILIPYMISIIIVSYLVYGFLATDIGFVNTHVLEPVFGIKSYSWYSTKTAWPFLLVFIYLWKNSGYSTIVYYSTLMGIDPGYFEAAVVDGATRWQRIRYITLPGLKSTVITLVLMAFGKIFYSDFGLFYQVPMNSGPLYDVTNTVDTYVYRGLMQLNNIGMSSAAGFYQSCVGFVLVLTANLIVKRISEEDALF